MLANYKFIGSTQKNILTSIVFAIILTAMSFYIGMGAGWIEELNWLEVFAVATSYSCTWLCTCQTRWNYPVGVVTTLAYSILYYQWGMPALSLFNLYLVFSLAYGWWCWGSDENTRPVTNIDNYKGYGLAGLVILALYVLAIGMFSETGFEVFGTTVGQIDLALAVMSGVAQLMLDRKKLQSWKLWATINVISIPYFFKMGLVLVSFQFIFFLANTVIGYKAWKSTMGTNK